VGRLYQLLPPPHGSGCNCYKQIENLSLSFVAH
jgi:hypothetical protein